MAKSGGKTSVGQFVYFLIDGKVTVKEREGTGLLDVRMYIYEEQLLPRLHPNEEHLARNGIFIHNMALTTHSKRNSYPIQIFDGKLARGFDFSRLGVTSRQHGVSLLVRRVSVRVTAGWTRVDSELMMIAN